MNKSISGKRRVLIVARWPVGGIRTYLRDLLAAPALADCEFVLVAPNEEGFDRFLQESNARCELVATDSSPVSFIRSISRVARSFDPSFVHSHGFVSGVYAGVSCRMTGYPHLLTVHDVLLDSQFVGFSGRAREFGLGASLGLPDLIHCVTEDSRQNLLTRYRWLRRLDGRAVVIPHGVDVRKIVQAPPRDVATEIGCNSNTVIFGFLGRFMAQKGFRVLMDAIAMLRDQGLTPQQARVLAVGSGGFLREDRARIEGMGLQDFFTFWPYQSDVSSILKGIHCLVMPSLWEASGLLAMEAIVAGTPVIGTSCIGLRETLGGTPAVMLAPGDPVALSRAVSDFIGAPSKAAAMEFQPQALRRFDAHQAFSSLADLYQRMDGVRQTGRLAGSRQ